MCSLHCTSSSSNGTCCAEGPLTAPSRAKRALITILASLLNQAFDPQLRRACTVISFLCNALCALCNALLQGVAMMVATHGARENPHADSVTLTTEVLWTCSGVFFFQTQSCC